MVPILDAGERAQTNESSQRKIKTKMDELSRMNGTCACLRGHYGGDAFPLGGAVSFACISDPAYPSPGSFLIVKTSESHL